MDRSNHPCIDTEEDPSDHQQSAGKIPPAQLFCATIVHKHPKTPIYISKNFNIDFNSCWIWPKQLNSWF